MVGKMLANPKGKSAGFPLQLLRDPVRVRTPLRVSGAERMCASPLDEAELTLTVLTGRLVVAFA